MHQRTNIQLSAIDRSALEAVVANRNSAQKHVWRAKIVLMTADDYGTAEIMRATGKAKTVIAGRNGSGTRARRGFGATRRAPPAFHR
jgi:hypothetical protein